MKKALLSSVAVFACAGAVNAADLPAKAPILKAAPAATYDWTGFYAGVNWGTTISDSRITPDQTLFGGGVTGVSHAGFGAGLQVGYNWQINPTWLVGLEADLRYVSTDRTVSEWDDYTSIGVKTDWQGTVRGRFGYVTGPSLLYLTGGVAFVHVQDTFGGQTSAPMVAAATSTTTKTGWTVGGGIETKLSPAWSTSMEYQYIDAGSNTFTGNPFGTPIQTVAQHRFHVIKSGLNYKFGGPAEGLPFFTATLLSPVRDWSGLYVGGNVGGGISLTRVTGGLPTATPPRVGEVDLTGNGFTAGVQAGYNFMLGPKWFVGVEGDIGYLGLNPSLSDFFDSTSVISQKTTWFGTLRARVGTSTGPALLYLTGGGAVVRAEDGLTNTALGTTDTTTSTAGGWTFGGGTEIALDPRWSAKLEYLYIDAGKSSHLAGGLTADFSRRFEVVRFGLNYKFGGADTVVARY